MELLCWRRTLPSVRWTRGRPSVVKGDLLFRGVTSPSLRPPFYPIVCSVVHCDWNGQQNHSEFRNTTVADTIPFASNNCVLNSFQFKSMYRSNFIEQIPPQLCAKFKLKHSNCSASAIRDPVVDLSRSVAGVDRGLRIQLRSYCTKQSKVNSAEKEAKDLSENTNTVKKTGVDLQYSTILTVPNLLTMLRMVLAPVLGYLVLQEAYTPACGVFVVAGLTDMLDGFIARNFRNQTSALGSFIDPLADKLLISILFVSLTAVNLLPVALTVLVVTRDVCLTSAGFYVRYISLNPRPKSLREFFDITNPSARLQPTLISKVNTAVQLSVVALTLAAPVFDFVENPALQALWYLTAVTTVMSGVGYIFARDTFKLLQQARKDD